METKPTTWYGCWRLDPLADAVIVEMDALDKEGRRILNAALADGLESLTERPPAITALLQQLETMPARDFTEVRILPGEGEC